MNDDQTIDLLGYLQSLLRHWLPALIVGLLVMLPLSYVAFNGKPVYNQKAQVLVMPPAVTTEAQAVQQGQLTTIMMRTYVALEDVPAFTEAVSQGTGGKFTPEEVTDQLKITWGGGSALLAFQGVANNLDDANLLANEGAKAFIEQAEKIVPKSDAWQPKMAVVETSKELLPPTSPRKKGAVLALGGGLMTATATAMGLEALAAHRRRRR